MVTKMFKLAVNFWLLSFMLRISKKIHRYLPQIDPYPSKSTKKGLFLDINFIRDFSGQFLPFCNTFSVSLGVAKWGTSSVYYIIISKLSKTLIPQVSS